MKNKKYLAILLFIVLLTGCAQGEEEKSLQKEMTYETEDQEEKKAEDFKLFLKANGETYIRTGIDYKVLSTGPKEEKKAVKKAIVSAPFVEGEVFEAEKTINDNEILYTLQDVKKEDVEEAYVQEVTAYSDYDYKVTEENVPETKTVRVTNERTGEEEEVTCTYTNIEKLQETISTYIDITYKSYDSDAFRWGDTLVEKSDEPQLDHEQLLKSVGADPNTYKIQRIYWRGNAYTKDGVIYRDARADVRRNVTFYRANYQGQINSPGTVYTAVYEGEKITYNHDVTVFHMKATADYKEFHVAVAVGAGIFIIAVAVVLILFFLSKKREKKEQENTGC